MEKGGMERGWRRGWRWDVVEKEGMERDWIGKDGMGWGGNGYRMG